MGQTETRVDGDLSCFQCYAFYLIEIIKIKNDIFIKKYCYCGTSTSPLRKDIIYSILRFDFFKESRCHKEQEIMLYENNNIINYCIQCKQFLCDKCSIKHNHKTFIKPKILLQIVNFIEK